MEFKRNAFLVREACPLSHAFNSSMRGRVSLEVPSMQKWASFLHPLQRYCLWQMCDCLCAQLIIIHFSYSCCRGSAPQGLCCARGPHTVHLHLLGQCCCLFIRELLLMVLCHEKKLLFIQCKPFKLRHLRVVFVWRARLSAFTPWSPMLLPVMFHPGQCYD